MIIKITPKAKKFMQQRGIEDVTFRLNVHQPAGCCIGIVKEIEAIYQAPANATNYKYYRSENFNIFVSRDIKPLGPLSVSVEGLWKLKRLSLDGAGIPI